MERPLVCKHLTASLTGPEHLAEWSRVLLQHHRDIQTAIDQIITLLAQPLSHLHRIEALLRRLSRAVLMHLELEACFLEPAMQTVPDPGGEKLQSLRDGYKNLRRAVMTATDFLQREKLRHPDLTLSAEQQKVITHLVNDIGTRLQVEDPLYQQFHGGLEMYMNLQLGNRTVALSWHQQGLVSGALNGLYGREILTRARYIDNGETVTPNRLFPLLKSQPQQLLELTVRQIQTVMALDDQWNLDGSLWFNLAGELLEDDRLFEILLKTALYPLPPSLRQRVVLEVAEDALEGSLILERVETLRRYGFLIAMDDFGAGYSNLGRLQEGGFDIIKLDLGLIRGVPERIWAASFYREVVDLAASSGSLVVAEGVEHQTQSDFVRWAGVDIIQGFFYSRPQPLLAKRNGGLSLYGDIARSNEPDILLISS